jgi:hypothetical protein
MLTFAGSGFAPNERVSLWASIPSNCSGMGWNYWSAFGAVDLSEWGPDAGITGESNIRADSHGAFATTVLMSDTYYETFPCLGTWALSARSLKTGVGAIAYFEVVGESVASSAMVWTDESSVPAIGQMYDCYGRGCGIGVHVNGSGFPAGSQVTCWFTRPDGTLYIGWNLVGTNSDAGSFKVDKAGIFKGVALTYTSENGYQAEQPGVWSLTCGTPDKRYVGLATFNVFSFIDP